MNTASSLSLTPQGGILLRGDILRYRKHHKLQLPGGLCSPVGNARHANASGSVFKSNESAHNADHKAPLVSPQQPAIHAPKYSSPAAPQRMHSLTASTVHVHNDSSIDADTVPDFAPTPLDSHYPPFSTRHMAGHPSLHTAPLPSHPHESEMILNDHPIPSTLIPVLPPHDDVPPEVVESTLAAHHMPAPPMPLLEHSEPLPHTSHTQHTGLPIFPVTPLDSSPSASPTSSIEEAPAPAATPSKHGIPTSILILSVISGALTMSSCVFNTLLPVYMVTELNLSMRSMGMFEGMLEAFSYVVRMFSGIISDLTSSRKATIALGFAIGATAKFGISFSSTITNIFIGKAVDRLSNGIQAAPRDALIGDLSPPDSRSVCFGVAQAMRKWGSFVGALSVFALMRASGNNYQLIFMGAATLSLLSCIAFIVFVPGQQSKNADNAPGPAPEASETKTAESKPKLSFNLSEFMADLRSLPSDFFRMLLVVAMYGMGHVQESMLEARAIQAGYGKAESTLVVAALAFMTFLTAVPLGRLDDKYGPKTTFSVGMTSLILGDLVLLATPYFPPAVFLSCIFLGVHWAVIQGPLLSMVVSLSPTHLRGTAFGIFYTVMALTAVAANTMYGTVWHTFNASAAYGLSAVLICGALLAVQYLLPSVEKKERTAAAA